MSAVAQGTQPVPEFRRRSSKQALSHPSDKHTRARRCRRRHSAGAVALVPSHGLQFGTPLLHSALRHALCSSSLQGAAMDVVKERSTAGQEREQGSARARASRGAAARPRGGQPLAAGVLAQGMEEKGTYSQAPLAVTSREKGR